MTTAERLRYFVGQGQPIGPGLANQAAAELEALTQQREDFRKAFVLRDEQALSFELQVKTLTAERDRLRDACQSALDWATAEGLYSDGKDTVATLAEEVAPKLEAALKGETHDHLP